jgi:hypothetical protein
MKVSIFCSALVTSIASLVTAQTLEGTESITPQDYIGLRKLKHVIIDHQSILMFSLQ